MVCPIPSGMVGYMLFELCKVSWSFFDDILQNVINGFHVEERLY